MSNAKLPSHVSAKKPPTIIPGQVKPVAAVKLAAWLYLNHPTLFNQMVVKARAHQKALAASAKSGATKLSGFGACGCGCANCAGNCPGCAASGKVVSLSAYRSRLGSLTSDLSSLGSSLSSSLSSEIPAAVSSSSGGSSGGFWSSLGSDLSSAGSAVLSGVSDVGSYLTTGGGLGALTGLANNYFQAKAQQTVTQAQAAQQQAILQAQTQQIAMGGYPAAVTYGTNALGQQVPMYASNTGYQALTANNFGSVFSNSSTWLPWALGGGAALILVITLLK